MSQVRILFRPSQGAGLVMSARPHGLGPPPLDGGRAVAWWQHEVVRSTGRLDRLRWARAWADALSDVRPRLREGPLLGPSLAALTTLSGGSSEPQMEAIQPQQHWATRPERPRALKRDREAAPADSQAATTAQSSPLKARRATERAAQVPGERPSPHPVPAPFRLEPTAGHAMLSRLAGEMDSDEDQNHAPNQPSRTMREPGSSTSSSISQRVGGKRAGRSPRANRSDTDLERQRASPSVSREARDWLDWLGDLARRAARALHQNGADRLPWRAWPNSPGSVKAPSLAAPWATPLDGPPAPAGLLARLIGASAANAGGSGGETQRSSVTWPSQSPPASRQTGERSAPSHRWARPTDVPGADDDSTNREEQIELLSWPTVYTGPRGQIAAPTADDVYPFAPPTAASSLPPLFSQQLAERPPFPVAAAIVRQDARQEGTAAEEDLSALATRIKRILDEQARRHGIDV
jgi:hypothetical protein